MRRRELLAGLGATATAGLAGCRGYWEDDEASTSPWVETDVSGPIARHSIRLHEPRRNRRVRRVRVAWDEAANAVHVTGVMRYGSANCDRPGIVETRYEADSDRLFVGLAPKERDGVDRCSMNQASETYRATIAFEDSLPATVCVESAKTLEGRRLSEPTTVERTVDRAEQRELCTSDHPEGSEAAETAHWTCPEGYVRAADSHPERTPTATPEE
jgi:hypothetical protein